MRYLHTMVRVGDLDAALDFYCAKFGLREVRRQENAKGRFTLVFLATPQDAAKLSGDKTSALSPMVELTYNWDEKDYSGGRNFGHLAYAVADIYALCARLMAAGVTINRPPRDGHMAFIRSPDGISIELLQKGDALAPQEPWLSMPNTGVGKANSARGFLRSEKEHRAERTDVREHARRTQSAKRPRPVRCGPIR